MWKDGSAILHVTKKASTHQMRWHCRLPCYDTVLFISLQCSWKKAFHSHSISSCCLPSLGCSQQDVDDDQKRSPTCKMFSFDARHQDLESLETLWMMSIKLQKSNRQLVGQISPSMILFGEASLDCDSKMTEGLIEH